MTVELAAATRHRPIRRGPPRSLPRDTVRSRRTTDAAVRIRRDDGPPRIPRPRRQTRGRDLAIWFRRWRESATWVTGCATIAVIIDLARRL